MSNGIPQGSPISGILSAFYSSELLEKFAERAGRLENTLPDRGIPATISAFVDDCKLTTHSTSLDSNCEELKNAFEFAYAWLRSAGLAHDAGKSELIHHPWT